MFTTACNWQPLRLERMDLREEDDQTVGLLIATHLEMSSTLRRRDIYDPETARELAHKVGTPERLKMLTLLTLADIKAVNPEALTPWKAENLWRLYTGTANYFTRSADSERFHAEECSAQVERIAALLPTASFAIAEVPRWAAAALPHVALARAGASALRDGEAASRRTGTTRGAPHRRPA